MLYLNLTYNTNKTVFRGGYNTVCLCYIKVTLTYYGQMYLVQILNENARNLQGNVRTHHIRHTCVGLHSTDNMDHF